MNVFDDMPEAVKKALASAGFSEPTPIQAQALPLVKAGSDVLGIAQTGTGKTAAFVLPMLQRMLLDPRQGIRALILCPTRELAAQVDASISELAKFTNLRHVAVFGGVGQAPQVKALKQGVDIVVATPGRLMDLYDQAHVNLKQAEFFVLDEADRMLDMGFIHDIKKISALIPKTRQTLFFSATMSKDVTKLAHTLLNNPTRIEITPQATPVESVDHKVLFVDGENKTELLLHLLQQKHLVKVLIFTRTKRGADRITRVLKKNKITASQIHSDRTQGQRTHALSAFAQGKVRCLVATDVAARGIDIDDISHVINYDLPMEAENYVHRIGRTARAGAEGTAYSFCTADDKHLLKEIVKSIGSELPVFEHKFHSEKAQTSRAGKPKKQVRKRSSSPRGKSEGRFGVAKKFGPRKKTGERGEKKSFGMRFGKEKNFRGSKGRSFREEKEDDRSGRGRKPFAKKKAFKGRFSRRENDSREDDTPRPRGKKGRAAPKKSGPRRGKIRKKGSLLFKKRHGRTPGGGRR